MAFIFISGRLYPAFIRPHLTPYPPEKLADDNSVIKNYTPTIFGVKFSQKNFQINFKKPIDKCFISRYNEITIMIIIINKR